MKPKLENSPETKSITFPMWRDENEHYRFVDAIVGGVAFWAVRQSPYDCPEDIEAALKNLTTVLKEDVACMDRKKLSDEELKLQVALGTLSKFTCDEIRRLLERSFRKVPEIMAWNEKKCPNKEIDYDNLSRDPDTDFIDLDALARNVSHTLILESLYDKD